MSYSSQELQAHLDRVSRSFAFCIRQLPEPLRLWVGVSYLLCRLVDTIEDSDFAEGGAQEKAFDWFDRCISSPNESGFSLSKELFPLEITEGERLLLEDSEEIFKCFWGVEPETRELISKLALSMSLGMRHFRLRSQGQLRLADLKEVNQYCFFVAGLVGEMLLGFVSRVEPRFSVSRPRLLKAHHFGLFLQKVNLLKDQLKDQKLGRFLVPSRKELKASAGENAREAFNFLSELPLEQVEFRRFCAWSLFMGLNSMGRSKKPTRPETEDLLLQVEERLQDNAKLKELFKTFSEKLDWKESSLPRARAELAAPGWLMGLYKGKLESVAVGSLGIS